MTTFRTRVRQGPSHSLALETTISGVGRSKKTLRKALGGCKKKYERWSEWKVSEVALAYGCGLHLQMAQLRSLRLKDCTSLGGVLKREKQAVLDMFEWSRENSYCQVLELRAAKVKRIDREQWINLVKSVNVRM